ncbi:MAG: hypothetical protein OXI92_03945 [Acidobacteriota bacterium]|nr:hypothetical protein [Acidobacteriota bacterium]
MSKHSPLGPQPAQGQMQGGASVGSLLRPDRLQKAFGGIRPRQRPPERRGGRRSRFHGLFLESAAGRKVKAFYKREAQHRQRYRDGFFIGLLFGLLWELRYWILLGW